MADLGSLVTTGTQKRVAAIVELSFDTRPTPSGLVSRREVVRRVEIAKEIFRALHADCGWSEQRIFDHLPVFLARGLDGLDPVPSWATRKVGDSESAMWGAKAAGRVEPERRLSALAKGGEPLIVIPGRGYQ